MAKQAAESNESSFFDGIDIGELEDQLLTVDVPETPEADVAAAEAGAGEQGGGEPGSKGGEGGDKPEAGAGGGEKPEDKPEDTIIVDTGGDAGGGEEGKPAASTKEDKTKGGGTSDSESESPVYLHAAALQENGVLPNFNLDELKELDPAQGILKINEHIQVQIDESIDEGVKEFKEGVGGRAVEFMEALEKGVPFEEAAENYTLEQQFGGISVKDLEDNQELQEALYTDFLSMKGFSDNKIKKLVATAVENEEILSEATDGLKEINGMISVERQGMIQRAEVSKKKREDANKETKTKIETAVNAVEEILPGVKVDDKTKKELVKQLTTPVRFEELPDGRKRPVSKSMDVRSKDPIRT